MKYDTAGIKVVEPIQNCDCGLTGGCKKCNYYWNEKLTELGKEQEELNNWNKRLDHDLKIRSKILFRYFQYNENPH